MIRTLVTAPEEELITLAEAKDQLNELGDDFDTTLNRLIPIAREHTEQVTGRALITQTWDVYPGGFPCGSTIYLPLGRL
ncbi:MAG TPA: hypothetical protein VFO36_12545, partial [Nitrospiraceae bacterium]|nr:hypothetical protein [Nitrospiraceae bacterium]